MDPETVHHLTIKFLAQFPTLALKSFGEERRALGKRFALKAGPLAVNFPVGLAAGLDKNAEAIDFFTQLAFGFVEVGTVTPRPQAGNPKPRLFRYPEEESLRNCMGFNNGGMDMVAAHLERANRHQKLVGVNLGKNKATAQELAVQDYLTLYQRFHLKADYLVVNISSPNTPGLRDLQSKEALREILVELKRARTDQSCPLFVKLSPDMHEDDLNNVLDTLIEFKIDGVIATNTTIMPERGPGGMSGRVLLPKAKKVRAQILERLRATPQMTLIGVGGISSFDDLWDFWLAGGKLVQIYSSFIFQGPSILWDMRNKMEEAMNINQVANLEELLAHIHEAKRPGL